MEQPAHKPAAIAGCHIIVSTDTCPRRQRSTHAHRSPHSDNKTHTTSAERRRRKQRKEHSASRTHEASHTPFVLPGTPFLDSPEWSSEDCIDAERYNRLFRRRRNASLQRRLREQLAAAALAMAEEAATSTPEGGRTASDDQPGCVREPHANRRDGPPSVGGPCGATHTEDRPATTATTPDKTAGRRRGSPHQPPSVTDLVPVDRSLHLPCNLPRLVLDEPASARRAAGAADGKARESRRLEIFPGKPLRRPADDRAAVSTPPLRQLPVQQSYDIAVHEDALTTRTRTESSASGASPASVMQTQPAHTASADHARQPPHSTCARDDGHTRSRGSAVQPSQPSLPAMASLPPPTVFASSASSYCLAGGNGMTLMNLWESESTVSQFMTLQASAAGGCVADASPAHKTRAEHTPGQTPRDVTSVQPRREADTASTHAKPSSLKQVLPTLSGRETLRRKSSEHDAPATADETEEANMQMFYGSWIRQFMLLPSASVNTAASPPPDASHTTSPAPLDEHTPGAVAGEQPGYVVKADTVLLCEPEPHCTEAYSHRSAGPHAGALRMLTRANTTQDSPCPRPDDAAARAGLCGGEYDNTTTVQTTQSLPCITIETYDDYDDNILADVACNHECGASVKEAQEANTAQRVHCVTQPTVAVPSAAVNISAGAIRRPMYNVLVTGDKASGRTAVPQVQYYSPHRHGTARLRMHVTDVSARALLARQTTMRQGGRTVLAAAVPSPRKMTANNTLAQLEPGRVELGRYSIVRTNSAMRAALSASAMCVPRPAVRPRTTSATAVPAAVTTAVSTVAPPSLSSSSSLTRCAKWCVVDAATRSLARSPSLMASSYFSVWDSSQMYSQGM